MVKQIHITSLQHPIVKHLVKLRENRTYRYDCKRVVISSGKVLKELAKTAYFPTILHLEGELVPDWLKADTFFSVSLEVLKKVSGVMAPELLIGEVGMPEPRDLFPVEHMVAFDGVADPGNMGTLFRTALAFGWQGAFLLPGCCDPYNDKALAAARGATFRLPWRSGSWEELSQLAKARQLPCFVADIEGVAVDSIQTKKGSILILGNEAHGPDKKARELGTAITLPMAGVMESLNVAIAGGILLYLLQPFPQEEGPLP